MHTDWEDQSYPTTFGRKVRMGTADIDAKGGEYRLIATHTANANGEPQGETELWLASRDGKKDAFENGPSMATPILVGPLFGKPWLSGPVEVAVEAASKFLGERFMGALHGWEQVVSGDEGEAA